MAFAFGFLASDSPRGEPEGRGMQRSRRRPLLGTLSCLGEIGFLPLVGRPNSPQKSSYPVGRPLHRRAMIPRQAKHRTIMAETAADLGLEVASAAGGWSAGQVAAGSHRL